MRASRGAGRDLAMAPNLDQEIDLLLEKLNGIQAEVGVAKSSEGKEAEESGAAAAPRSGGDRFLDLKGMMISKLKEIKKIMQEQQEQRASGGPSNPKQQIEQDSKVRKILRELNEDLQELEQLVKRCNYFCTKAKNVAAVAAHAVRHRGALPTNVSW